MTQRRQDTEITRAPPLAVALVVCGALACAAPKPLVSGPVVATAPAPAAPATKAPAAKSPDDAPLPIDPTIRVGRLGNGLTYYVRHHGKPEKRASLRLAVNAGSLLEENDQRGLAHFVEHMAFNGTRLYQKQEIVDFMEKVGMRFGQDANASTSFDETLYTFEVPADDPAILDKGLSILQQIASDVSFEAGEVDRERKVIVEEWRLGLGAEMRVMEQLMPVIFKGSRYADRLPIGTRAVLDKTTSADLLRFYRKWYRPDLMAVMVVGDFDVPKVEARVREVFGAIPKPTTPLPVIGVTVPEQPKTLVAIAKDKELPSTTIGVLHKLPHRPEASANDYRAAIVDGLFHSMMNARLEELTRSETPPFLYAASMTQSLVRPMDVYAQLAGVRQGEVGRGLAALTREVERVDRHGFTAGELERAKAERMRGMEGLGAEREKLPSGGFADEMVRNFLTAEAMPGIAIEVALHERFLPTITLAEMNAVAKELVSEKNRVIMVQAPESSAVPNEAGLLGVFDTVQKENITAYVDALGDGPLVQNPPKPGRITRERKLDAVGAVEWRLSNGATVVVKPTDFKNDEVLLGATSPGGTSLVADKDFVSATYAADVVSSGGLGNLDPSALRKALSGKLASVSPFITELEEGVVGRASPKDLETMLQLVYLTFTAPRKDAPTFAALRAQLGEQLSHRIDSPEASFADERERLVYLDHPRRRPLKAGDEAKLELDPAMRIYKERFAAGGGTTFVFVGTLQLDVLKPFVEKYLASLPRARKSETWRDVGVETLTGAQTFAVVKGIDPKSTVSLTFVGKQKWSREDDHTLGALLEAMGIRLREQIREELGATYGVQVSGDLVRRPKGHYRIDVVFSCAPEQVDKATAAVWQEITKAQKEGLPASYLEKVQAAERRALESALKSNGFWMAQLTDSWRFRTDPKLILEQSKLIDGLTTARLKEAAGRYFRKAGYVEGVLRPAPASASR